MHKIRHPVKHNKLKHAILFFSVYVLFIFAIAMILPIFPLFIKKFVARDAYVGLLMALFAVEWIIITTLMDKILRKINKLHLAYISLLGLAISFLFLPLLTRLWQLILVEVFRVFCFASMVVIFGLFIRELAVKRNIGKIEGLSAVLMNIGYLLGPLLGGLIAKSYEIVYVFVFSSAISFIALGVLFFSGFKEKMKKQVVCESVVYNIKDFFKQRDFRLLYLISAGLMILWVMIYTFTPLFFKSQGATESLIGIALAIVVVPLLLLEVITGTLADRHGYRKYFILGFSMIAVALFFAAFMKNLYFFIGFLVIASFGAAFIEPLREAYFFKLVKKKDETRFYTVYRTASDMAYLVAPLLFSAVLLLTDDNYTPLYIVGAILMVMFAVLSSFLKRRKA